MGSPLLDPHVQIMFSPSHLWPREKLKVLISSNFNRKVLPVEHENEINNIWEERVRANPKLWNGTKFRIESAEKKDDYAIFNLGITDYKEFIGTNWSPNAKLFHHLGTQNHGNQQAYMSDALGVGSLVETSDNHMILLRRSIHCGEAQGLWDIPGGHPEPQELVGKMAMQDIPMSMMKEEDIVREIFDSTLREIVDEVNVPLETLTDPCLIGIARNTTSAGRPSSEYFVRCSLNSDEVRERYEQGSHAEAEESTNIMFIPMQTVLNLQNHPVWKDMAPSAKGCVTLYQMAMHKCIKDK